MKKNFFFLSWYVADDDNAGLLLAARARAAFCWPGSDSGKVSR